MKTSNGESKTLHAATRAGALDTAGRKALLRHVLRPPIAHRVEPRPNGLLRITLKRPFSDGTTAIDMDPLSLLTRLAASVPPPRFHTVKYAGVLAPASTWRARIAPKPGGVLAPIEGAEEKKPRGAATMCRPWADLLLRTFSVGVLLCPKCAGRMQLLAVVTKEESVVRFLRARGELDEVPPRTKSRGRATGSRPCCAGARRTTGSNDGACSAPERACILGRVSADFHSGSRCVRGVRTFRGQRDQPRVRVLLGGRARGRPRQGGLFRLRAQARTGCERNSDSQRRRHICARPHHSRASGFLQDTDEDTATPTSDIIDAAQWQLDAESEPNTEYLWMTYRCLLDFLRVHSYWIGGDVDIGPEFVLRVSDLRSEGYEFVMSLYASGGNKMCDEPTYRRRLFRKHQTFLRKMKNV